MKIELGFMWVLFLIFLTLKLCGVIAWSWWWVCAPLFSPIFIVIVIGILYFLGWMLKELIRG